jgi:hypothetical protein
MKFRPLFVAIGASSAFVLGNKAAVHVFNSGDSAAVKVRDIALQAFYAFNLSLNCFGLREFCTVRFLMTTRRWSPISTRKHSGFTMENIMQRCGICFDLLEHV